MEEALPITISSSQSLASRYKKLLGILNKQEAQINFQTLAAGWYEDEDNILEIRMHLLCETELSQRAKEDYKGEKVEVSDDVILFIGAKELKCLIAITSNEIELLDNKPNALSGYISIKIKKVINAIAQQQQLLALP